MADVIDFSALPDKLKAYSLSNSSSILTKLLIDGMSFLSYAQLLIGNDEISLTELVIGEVLQPGGKDDFNPKGGFKFKARIGKVRPCKVDLTFKQSDIDRIWKSYLGEIAKAAAKSSPYDLPFESFFMGKIVEKAQADLRLKAVYKGVHNPTGTAAADTMNGYLTILKAMITAGEVPAANIFAGAPITETNALEQFKGVKKLVAEEYRDQPLICLAAPSKIEAYMEDYQITHGSLPYNTEFKKSGIEGSNIRFIAEPSMAGSNRIIITPEVNIFWLANNLANVNSIIIEKEKRNIHVLMDFECAPEFGVGALVWTNDQE
ncbi:hypothetical protein [Adhaeribacter pallidiroseus]|uniref:Uncharacterized protein n=1 Tax=Adhaeribacter pallidiroseus TaxID=2072847 RepID=A0A369QEZ7_9BACT|nr:hypothetical protein [Adhaeribacter pallidiroseus]RDC63284.1 hypothetical protein AHMF7616_01886 [Adhaeribacter pallidiroseus]